MKEVKVGDVVHVKARVQRIGLFGCPVLDVSGSMDTESRLHIDPAAIVHVETRPLQVGDVVQIGNGWGSERYELRAIVDDQAMLRKRVAYTSDDYEYVVRALSQLERV